MAQTYCLASELVPRMALGVIVKLRDVPADVPTVAQLSPSLKPGGSAAQLASRMVNVAIRQGSVFLKDQPTAFGALVVHTKMLMPLAEAEAMAARLRRDQDVEWVIVNEVQQTNTVTGLSVLPVTDPDYASQLWLQSRGTGTEAAADIPAAWTQLAGLSLTPPVVAILDTGILSPTDLQGRVLPGYDFVSELEYSRDGSGLDSDPQDPGDWLTSGEKAANPVTYADPCDVHDSSWHGLSIASMLGSIANNGNSGAGILSPIPNTVPWLLPVRVSGTCGAALSDIIEGMLWAAGVSYQGSPTLNANPARVINISLGGSGACGALYQQTIDQLRDLGVVVVASAGNGDDATGIGNATLTRPANCNHVLAVTGLNMSGYKAVYANLVDTGKDWAVAVAAGDGIYNPSTKAWTLSDGGMTVMTNTGTTSPTGTFSMTARIGTSFAAPTAAGVAAMMLAVNPALSVDDVLTGLTSTSHAFTDFTPGRPACDTSHRGNCSCAGSQYCGAGQLDAGAAVHYALNTPGSFSYSSPNASASYFVPDRLATSTTTQSGGGGGGSVDVWMLILLAMAAAFSTASARFSGRL